MHPDLSRLVHDGHGVVGRADTSRVPRWAIGHAAAAGELVRVLPRTYVLAGLEDDPPTLRRAALAYAGPYSALSHLSALEQWRLALPPSARAGPISVTVPVDRRLRADGLVLPHRRKDFTGTAPQVVTRDGLPVVTLHRALVESWPLLRVEDRLGPCMTAINKRWTTAALLQSELVTMPNLADRAEFQRVISLIGSGCHSWLEIVGCRAIFDHPSMPPSRAQVAVRVGSRTFYLDRLFDDELVAVELDGADSHGGDQARERDRRRDAALASLGIVVVRYTYRRLTYEPDAVRVELGQILATRRRQLGCA